MTEFPSADHFRVVARRYQELAEDTDEPELAAVYVIRACTYEAKAQQAEIEGLTV